MFVREDIDPISRLKRILPFSSNALDQFKLERFIVDMDTVKNIHILLLQPPIPQAITQPDSMIADSFLPSNRFLLSNRSCN